MKLYPQTAIENLSKIVESRLVDKIFVHSGSKSTKTKIVTCQIKYERLHIKVGNNAVTLLILDICYIAIWFVCN